MLMWLSHDTHTMLMWSHDTHTMLMWLSHGTHTMLMWLSHGTHTMLMWHHMVHIQCSCGNHMIHIQCSCDHMIQCLQTTWCLHNALVFMGCGLVYTKVFTSGPEGNGWVVCSAAKVVFYCSPAISRWKVNYNAASGSDWPWPFGNHWNLQIVLRFIRLLHDTCLLRRGRNLPVAVWWATVATCSQGVQTAQW